VKKSEEKKNIKKKINSTSCSPYFKIYHFIIEDNYKLTTLEGKKTHFLLFYPQIHTNHNIDQIAII